MKIFKNTTIVLAALAAVALASCNNDQPEFNDKDAFVSFTDTKASIDENKATLEIPVQLSSLKGKEGSVDFEITADKTAPAVEGTNYTVANATRTLTFTKESNVQNIKLNIIDLAGTFTGDLRLNIKLKNAQGVNLGAESSFDVTIVDLDHPLAFMLGTFSASGTSQYNGAETWTVNIAKDDKDVNKVWITNMVLGASSAAYPIYGTVNEEKTEIRIPAYQVIAKSSSYPAVLFTILDSEGENIVEDYMLGKITTDANGKAIISFTDNFFGTAVFDSATPSEESILGFLNLYQPGVVLKKN